ncbi:MAG: alpha-L-fucosidase, partial [Rectinemataceae bacterium]
PWETCMTIGRSWAFNPNETVWKTPRELVRNLVLVASGGGNYLLNVGPTDKGTFPPESLERLAYVGRWMEKNSAAIYGSSYTPLPIQAWGRATQKGDKVFLHVFEWPSGGKLQVAGFPSGALKASLLSGETLSFKETKDGLEVSVPEKAPDPDVSLLVIDIDPGKGQGSTP